MRKAEILIAGAHGFVGSRAMECFPAAVPVPGELLRNPGEQLDYFIKEHNPDIILNAAAISDIGVCERNPDASYMANVTLPVLLAKTVSEIGAKLISFSSDQVYTGCPDEGPYSEAIPLPLPANVYACHKLEAEQRVLDQCPDAVMLRATWMYDMPIYGGGKELGHANRGNFFLNVLRAVLRGEELGMSSREYRGITYVRQAVALLEQTFQLPGGVYNYGSENSSSMLETTLALLEILGLEGDVRDTGTMRHNLWIDCGKISNHGIVFDTTVEGFTRCADDYGVRPRPGKL